MKEQRVGSSIALTPREREVTSWLAQGKSQADVAVILGCSVKTVEAHVRGAMGKLATANRAELVLAAIRLGIVPCPCELASHHVTAAMRRIERVIAEIDALKAELEGGLL